MGKHSGAQKAESGNPIFVMQTPEQASQPPTEQNLADAAMIDRAFAHRDQQPNQGQ